MQSDILRLRIASETSPPRHIHNPAAASADLRKFRIFNSIVRPQRFVLNKHLRNNAITLSLERLFNNRRVFVCDKSSSPLALQAKNTIPRKSRLNSANQTTKNSQARSKGWRLPLTTIVSCGGLTVFFTCVIPTGKRISPISCRGSPNSTVRPQPRYLTTALQALCRLSSQCSRFRNRNLKIVNHPDKNRFPSCAAQRLVLRLSA